MLQRGGVHGYAIGYQQPVGGGQVGVGAARVLGTDGLGSQVQHAVCQLAGGLQRLVFHNVEITGNVGFDELTVPLADAVGKKQHSAVQRLQRVVQG